jgi:bud site selection protein 20
MPAIRGQESKKKTRRHTRDLDQIHADLRDEKHLAEFKDAKPIEDLPGLGQHYCKECAKFFESETNFHAHQKGKVHKRRYGYIRIGNLGQALTFLQSQATSRRTVLPEGSRAWEGPYDR